MKLFTWFYRNISTLLLAFLLAVVVWISATTESDPNQERTFRAVPLTITGKDQNMLVIGDVPSQISVTLYAPRSRLALIDLQSSLLKASADLSDLNSGSHTLPVHVAYQIAPARLVRIEPAEINISLDELISREFPVLLVVEGKPALGYQAKESKLDEKEVTITGPKNLVDQVKDVRVQADIGGRNDVVSDTLTPQVFDRAGQPVTGLTISPATIHFEQNISLINGYSSKVVRVITTGQVADGYRLDNILVLPLRVLLFSPNPKRLDEMPGYVETEPLDLNYTDKNIESRLTLKLPEDISIVGDQTIRVRVSISAIESSLAMKVPIEVVGLSPELHAELPLETVDVLLAGPVKILSETKEKNVRVIVDLTDMTTGIYQVMPRVDILPDDVRTLSIAPPSLEIQIVIREDGDATPSAATGSPSTTPSPTPRPTHTPTPTPTLTLPSSVTATRTAGQESP